MHIGSHHIPQALGNYGRTLQVLDLTHCAELTDAHTAHMFVQTKVLRHLDLSG